MFLATRDLLNPTRGCATRFAAKKKSPNSSQFFGGTYCIERRRTSTCARVAMGKSGLRAGERL
jgi:hypothetical protein